MAMFAKVKKDLGGVDVCINNAGLSNNTSLLGEGRHDGAPWHLFISLGLPFYPIPAYRLLPIRSLHHPFVSRALKPSRRATFFLPSTAYFVWPFPLSLALIILLFFISLLTSRPPHLVIPWLYCLTEGTPTEWRQMMDVNVVGLCLCTRESIASMRERGVDDGHVIHIGRYI